MSRDEARSGLTGKDLGLGGDWADVEVVEWTEADELTLQQAKRDGRWRSDGFGCYDACPDPQHKAYLRAVMLENAEREIEEELYGLPGVRERRPARGPSRDWTLTDIRQAIRKRHLRGADVTPELIGMDLGCSGRTVRRVLGDYDTEWKAVRGHGRVP
jgi:hypothetical protein